MAKAAISGLGHYVPPRVMTNFDLERMVETSDQWIQERTGIAERRIADPGVATSDLAVEAARRALADAHVDPSELDLIIVASATPDMTFPATANIVQSLLGATSAGACDLSSGCAGFVYALSIGSQFIETGCMKKVLVIGADTLSKILNWKDRNTCVLFGDGAGAAVLEPAEDGYGILGFNLRADGAGAQLLELPAGGSRLPASAETVAENLHYVHMTGGEVFKFAVKAIAESTLDVLRSAGLAVEDVDLFVPHQANRRIITSAAKRVGVPDERVFSNVHRYGNTSCASIPLALSEAYEFGRIRRGDVVAMCGFGAGFSWGGTVMRWSKVRATLPTGGHMETPHPLQPDPAQVEQRV